MFDDADLIHRYTRADALRDGVLIDVSAAAREAGIRFPVALTFVADGTVPADALVDVSEADWRKCGSCGVGRTEARYESEARGDVPGTVRPLSSF
jgi:hypothetical protein